MWLWSWHCAKYQFGYEINATWLLYFISQMLYLPCHSSLPMHFLWKLLKDGQIFNGTLLAGWPPPRFRLGGPSLWLEILTVCLGRVEGVWSWGSYLFSVQDPLGYRTHWDIGQQYSQSACKEVGQGLLLDGPQFSRGPGCWRPPVGHRSNWSLPAVPTTWGYLPWRVGLPSCPVLAIGVLTLWCLILAWLATLETEGQVTRPSTPGTETTAHRANLQATGIEDLEAHCKSYAKTSLTGSGLPALVKDKAGLSALAKTVSFSLSQHVLAIPLEFLGEQPVLAVPAPGVQHLRLASQPWGGKASASCSSSEGLGGTTSTGCSSPRGTVPAFEGTANTGCSSAVLHPHKIFSYLSNVNKMQGISLKKIKMCTLCTSSKL